MDITEINREIAVLERKASSFGDCEKLSVLYNIRNNLEKQREPEKRIASYSAASKSDFIKAAQALDTDTLLTVLDEHMDVIQAVFPKEYNAVIRKLKEPR